MKQPLLLPEDREQESILSDVAIGDYAVGDNHELWTGRDLSLFDAEPASVQSSAQLHIHRWAAALTRTWGERVSPLRHPPMEACVRCRSASRTEKQASTIRGRPATIARHQPYEFGWRPPTTSSHQSATRVHGGTPGQSQAHRLPSAPRTWVGSGRQPLETPQIPTAVLVAEHLL